MKAIDLSTFQSSISLDGKVRYHSVSGYTLLYRGQEFIASVLNQDYGYEFLINGNKGILGLASYPNGEWIETDVKIIYANNEDSGHFKKEYVEGDPVYLDIPVIIEICDRCSGKGTMGNPSLNGTTTEWWQEHGGPDWQDDLDEYIHGDMYDVKCEYRCDNGKAWTINWPQIMDYSIGDPEKWNEFASKLWDRLEGWHINKSELYQESVMGY
tara:strand:- start:1135 stop:1770 length:636 start_codon:yes stop_codon:yes gene_type:complete